MLGIDAESDGKGGSASSSDAALSDLQLPLKKSFDCIRSVYCPVPVPAEFCLYQQNNLSFKDQKCFISLSNGHLCSTYSRLRNIMTSNDVVPRVKVEGHLWNA